MLCRGVTIHGTTLFQILITQYLFVTSFKVFSFYGESVRFYLVSSCHSTVIAGSVCFKTNYILFDILRANMSTWNLKHLYESLSDPQIEKDRTESKRRINSFKKKWAKRDDYLKDPKTLYLALVDYENLFDGAGIYTKESYFLGLKKSLEQGNTNLDAKEAKLNELFIEARNETMFFKHKIAKIPESEQRKILKKSILKDYYHYIETTLLEGRYNLTEDEEKMISLISKPATSNWTDMVESFLSTEEYEVKGKKATLQVLISNLDSEDKKLRDESAKGIHIINEKYSKIAEREINSLLEFHRSLCKKRGFTRFDEPRHLSDDIDTEVVDALRNTVEKNYQISKEFYKLKAKLLGLKKLKYHERYVKPKSVLKKYSYEKAFKLVDETFSELDPEFSKIIHQFKENALIDVRPRKGKRGGAFCAGQTLPLPTYILLNHTGRLNDVLTMAHEFGHGINNEMMRRNLTELNFDSPTSTAEVASTFFEGFVLERLTKEATEEQQLTLMLQRAEDEVGTIIRQIAGYNFELELHNKAAEKGYLSREEIGKIFTKHMSAYMGPAVSQDKGSEYWWVYWKHFRSHFYVYSYASGLLISKSLQALVREDSKNIDKVKHFLSSGTLKSPKDIFMDTGIDISNPSFWEKGLEDSTKLLNDIEKLAKKLGKI
jgi:oligoendopeptidase F